MGELYLVVENNRLTKSIDNVTTKENQVQKAAERPYERKWRLPVRL